MAHGLRDGAQAVGRGAGEGLGDGGAVRGAGDGDFVKAGEAGLQAGEGLLHGFVDGAADGHRLAHGFHGGGQEGFGAGELLEGEAGDLGDDIVDGRLEEAGVTLVMSLSSSSSV